MRIYHATVGTFLEHSKWSQKYYEAITTVTHHFISNFLYFKGFLIQMNPQGSF